MNVCLFTSYMSVCLGIEWEPDLAKSSRLCELQTYKFNYVWQFQFYDSILV